jgi:hypothetical protein
LLIIYRKWQPFKNQKKGSGQYKTTLRYLRQIVENNGGGDASNLFAAYYSTNKYGKSFVHKLPIMKNILQILKTCHTNASDFDKRQWLSIVQGAGFKLKDLKDAGWEISSNYRAWKISTEHSSKFYPGAPVPETRGRKKKTGVEDSILEFVVNDKYSYISNRTVYNMNKYTVEGNLNSTREKVQVRYRNLPISKLFELWKEKRVKNFRTLL